jgi:hypothetical protein
MLHRSMRLAAALALIVSAAAWSFPATALECSQITGHVEETQVPPPTCLSPEGLCTIAQISGSLKGEAFFTASDIIVSADTPTTGVVFVIGDTVVVDARLGDKRGTLTVKNAAVFRTIGDGDLLDVQIITGGTGDFVGATGTVRSVGTFVAGSGSSTIEGFVCVP